MSLKLLNTLNCRLAKLVQKRDAVLAEVRRNCAHLRLVECDYCPATWCGYAYPPRRICIACGAEEDGWGCGYQVLVARGDCTIASHREERFVIERTSDSQKFYSYRQHGPLYFVGQSHPNFKGGGIKTYEQLTEIAPPKLAA